MNAPTESTTQALPEDGCPTQDEGGSQHGQQDLPQPRGQRQVNTAPERVAQHVNNIQIDHGRSIAPTTDKTCHDQSEVARMLAELPDLCARLEAGDIDGPTRASRRTPRDPAELSPVNLGRLDALDVRSKREVLNHVDHVGRPHPDHPGRVGQGENRLGILPAIDGWAVLLEDDMLEHSPELPDELPSSATMSGVCNWLARHLHWWEGKPQWDEFSDDVARQHRRARALVGWQLDDRQVHGGVGGCGGTVVRIGGDMWRCQGCGNERSLRSAATTSIPAAAKLLQLPERTLRSWATRNLITPIDPEAGERQREYSLTEVMRVRDEMGARRVVR